MKDLERRQVGQNHGPRGSGGANGNEMHMWFFKYISMWAKVFLRWAMWLMGLLFNCVAVVYEMQNKIIMLFIHNYNYITDTLSCHLPWLKIKCLHGINVLWK
jgi:hypothetical protein